MKSTGTSLRSTFLLLRRRQSTKVNGVWTNFSERAASLQLNNEHIKETLFGEGNPEEGPASLINQEDRSAYHSPVAIDETFQMAYKILERDAESKYQVVHRLKKSLANTTSDKDALALRNQIDKYLVDAEIENPEVLYNAEFMDPEHLDKSQPVYRHLLKEKWENYDLLVTMQRLEQLHVIPDTLPTLVPKADVKIKFTHNTDEQFSKWVTPGALLPAFAVSKPPTIHVQEFDRVEGNNNLYTVLLVNPDTPDLRTNSFTTTLHYGLKNVVLNNVDNSINISKLLTVGPKITFKEYVPLAPEKNAPAQRACLWVFRQTKELGDLAESSENFDIREFAANHGLTAVGAHVWRQTYDRSVPEIRKMYGLGEGRVYEKARSMDPINL
ncbi:MRPL35 [Candida theae]|uniref:Large ribosomal subunit protein mL38 n=1 Tax=Candida theae TaxID=1198502 RepID=A0AAD5BDM9_9ASCO|nr:MRPL35 [Candida theae]KAI5957664.1 MRPL35 [Candida theae]